MSRSLNKIGLFIFFLFLGWIVLIFSAPNYKNTPLPEELKKYEAATFWVCHARGCGTGWAFDKNLQTNEVMVVTAGHVCSNEVSSKEPMPVIIANNLVAKRVYIDKNNDICVLIIYDPDQKRLLNLAPVVTPEAWTLSRIELSSYKAQLLKAYTINLAQGGWCRFFRGAVKPGASGSAMINVDGEVTCMVVLGFDTIDVGACVPKNALEDFLTEVRRTENDRNQYLQ